MLVLAAISHEEAEVRLVEFCFLQWLMRIVGAAVAMDSVDGSQSSFGGVAWLLRCG